MAQMAYTGHRRTMYVLISCHYLIPPYDDLITRHF
jgi:hypothetical protein